MCTSEHSNFHIDAGLACGSKLSTTALTGITYCDDVLEGIAPADRQSCQAIYTNHGGLLVPAVSNNVSILLWYLTEL